MKRRLQAILVPGVLGLVLCLPGKLVAADLAAAGSVGVSAPEIVNGDRRSQKLRYDRPAAGWTEALPLGNGRLGAMVFGTVPKERLQLNEESLWAGEPADVYPDGFAENLKTVQRLVLEGKIAEARKLGLEKLTKSPTSYRSYEPLADLWIEMKHAAQVEDYHRELDLETGLARVTYRTGKISLQREVLISAVDDVVVVRLSAGKPGALRAKISLTRKKDMKVTAAGKDRLQMDGQIVDVAAPQGHDDNPGGSGKGGRHMEFAGRLLVRLSGGSVEPDGDALVIEGADEAVVLLSGATDFSLEKLNFDRTIDRGRRADAVLEKAAKK